MRCKIIIIIFLMLFTSAISYEVFAEVNLTESNSENFDVGICTPTNLDGEDRIYGEDNLFVTVRNNGNITAVVGLSLTLSKSGYGGYMYADSFVSGPYELEPGESVKPSFDVYYDLGRDGGNYFRASFKLIDYNDKVHRWSDDNPDNDIYAQSFFVMRPAAFIINPRNGLYLFDIIRFPLIPFNRLPFSIVVGSINVELYIADIGLDFVDYVEFFSESDDDNESYIDSVYPYEWKWNGGSGFYIIGAKIMGESDKIISTEKVIILHF